MFYINKMATEVSKYSVYDPRIVQTRPKYAVEKGALSITNVSFQAQTADSSSVQFNVQVPSENVFVDRAVEWQGSLCAAITVVTSGATIPEGASLQGLLAPAAFPLHQAVTQMSATINDATVTVNTQDVLPQVIRLADMRDARRQRTCPTMLDRYAVYPDSSVVKNTPLLDWSETKDSDQVPNGGFNGFYFATTPAGTTPCGTGGPLAGGPPTVSYLNGQPYANQAIVASTSLTFWVVVTSVEKLLLPPFIFADEDELSTGLFGVQNFQVQMNMSPSPSRTFRVAPGLSFIDSAGTRTWTTFSVSSAWSSTAAKGGIWTAQPSLATIFLTPSLEIPLPPKSVVNYSEYPRYISTPATLVPQSTNLLSVGTQLTSNTITLPNIPDLLVVYVKPASYSGPTQGDWSLPVTGVSLNFDNFSGLLSTMTQKQLYEMSVRNGVDMDWSEWSGCSYVPHTVAGGASGLPSAGGRVGLVGGPLVLKPGRDFSLSTGQACGLVGNFTLQFNLTVQNFTGADQTPNIYVIAVSTGFFETIKGSSRIIKGVLTEQDILAAPPSAPEKDLERPVGGRMPAAEYVRGMKPMGRGGAMNAYM